MRYDDAKKEWGALGDHAFVPSAMTYETKINSRTVQGERTRAGARQGGGTADDGEDIVGESQGGGDNGQTVNGAAVLARRLGQVEVTAESRSDVSAQGFWKQGTTLMFDIRIANLDTGYYLRIAS